MFCPCLRSNIFRTNHPLRHLRTRSSGVLTQRSTIPVDGRVWLDGTTRLIGKHVKKHVRYVQQQDALIGALTVRETLLFAAKLGITSSSTRMKRGKRDLHQHVDTVIARLGLFEQANTKVGTPIQRGLSGGQKRRVSVGEKLVSSTGGDEDNSDIVLVLDEVTSGLDAVAAHEVRQ
ncbi:hypothetical protein V1522DRAFT_431470 [Lipomyces starkeyi]